MGRRQPAVEGEHARLHAKAQQHQKRRQQKQPLVPGDFFRVQHAAGGEVQGGAVGVEDEEAEQHAVGPAQGVKQVFQARQHRFPLPVVEDQGESEQGHHLIAEIERGQIPGEAQAHQHPVDRQIEAEKPPVIRLMGHVPDSVDGGQQPDCRDQQEQQPSHVVRAQQQAQLRVQPQQHELSPDLKGAVDRRGPGGRQGEETVKAHRPPVVQRTQQKQQTGQQGKQDRQKQNPRLIHCDPPLSRTWPAPPESRTQWAGTASPLPR